VRLSDNLAMGAIFTGVSILRSYSLRRLFEAIRDLPAVCEHIAMPAQSGSNRILKLMRRNYTRRSLLEGVDKVRSAIPEIEISTDIIVGFPTETEEDFQASLSLLSAMKASTAYCFKYSPRESTESAGWPDDVSREAKEDRLRRLNMIVDEKIEASLKRQVGTDLEILTQREGFGRTRSGFRVRIDAPVPAGCLVKAGITGSTRLTLAGALKENGRTEYLSHPRVYRPWGWYQTLETGDRYQVKHLMVKPGHGLSLQSHKQRTEHWTVVAGSARVTRDDEVVTLGIDQSTYIPIGTKHRLENPGADPLSVIEVQSGNYLGEDDIVRFDDDYGRE